MQAPISTSASAAAREASAGPLAEVVRSAQGVKLVAHHDAIDGIDTRLLFRGWTKSTPAVSALGGHVTEPDRASWLRDALAALPATSRCYVGVGAGRDWLEIELLIEGSGARLLDAVLNASALHNTRLPFVDVCLLASDTDSVLMVRKTEKQTAAFIFGNLHERHRAQLRSREDAHAKHLQDYRRKLESVPGLAVRDVPTTDVALPRGEILCAEFEDPFDLPDVHESNERERGYRDRWLRDRLRSTPFAAPRDCFFWGGGTKAGSWWQLGLPAREDWASDLLYAVAGTRAGDDWSKWLRWSERFLFLSSDATWVMSWEVTEHLLHLHIYRTDVLLERGRSRSRLGEWLASQSAVLAWKSPRSGIRAADVFHRKWQTGILHGSVPRPRREGWLLDGMRRLSPRYEEELLSPEQRTQFVGSARLSIGTTVLPWTQLFWRDTTWLPRLWEELQPACLFIEGRSERWRGGSKVADASRTLGFRRTARTCETFLYSPPKGRGAR